MVAWSSFNASVDGEYGPYIFHVRNRRVWLEERTRRTAAEHPATFAPWYEIGRGLARVISWIRVTWRLHIKSDNNKTWKQYAADLQSVVRHYCKGLVGVRNN